MAIPITIPRLGWNMEQGTFVGWRKADGESLRIGEVLFALESDKSTEDVEVIDEGFLHIPASGPREGDVLPVGTIIGYVLQKGESIPLADHPVAVPSPLPTSTVEIRQPISTPSLRERPASSPRARRTATRLGVDWHTVSGTGRNGRIRERDILTRANATAGMDAPSPNQSTRRIIAERMLNSHRSTAPVTLLVTVDATNLVLLRSQMKSSAATGSAVPTYTDLFVKLTALALEQHPVLTARWDNDRIVSPDGIHIGIAVDTAAGLLVPVVRDVPRLSVRELASRTHELIERARLQKLSASEMRGGTFTVTSLGGLGIEAFTPIINYPECAILGVGCIRRCPVVLDEQIVIRDQVTLCLTFDHRITDGAPAARFLQTLRALIENPGALSCNAI